MLPVTHGVNQYIRNQPTSKQRSASDRLRNPKSNDPKTSTNIGNDQFLAQRQFAFRELRSQASLNQQHSFCEKYTIRPGGILNVKFVNGDNVLAKLNILLPITNGRYDLTGIDLERTDLTDADLTDAILAHAFLEHAHMEGAKMKRVDLSFSHLAYAHMEKANMMYSDLRCADMRLAHMAGTNLMFADMRLTRTELADLMFAKLLGAKRD